MRSQFPVNHFDWLSRGLFALILAFLPVFVAGAQTLWPEPANPILVAQAAASFHQQFQNNNRYDGCDLRAHLQNYQLKKTFGVDSRKVFLVARCGPSLQPLAFPRIAWHFHVASLVQVCQELVVLDGLLVSSPLPLAEWIKRTAGKLDPSCLQITIADQTRLLPDGVRVKRNKTVSDATFAPEVITSIENQLQLIQDQN